METKNNLCSSRDVSEKHLCKKSRTYQGFTLVELIVVITILVILGTIAFLNIGGFSASARDGTRISNLSALKKGLDIYQTRNGTYPMPEGPLNILASWSIIGYQWFAKDTVGGLANLSAEGTVDPSDSSIYTTYAVSYDQKKMQVMSFLEDGSSVTALNLPRPLREDRGEGFGRLTSSLIPTTFASIASDYSTRTPTTQGDSLGILLGNTGADLNKPVQEKYDASAFTGVDLSKTTTLSGYTMVFSKSDTTASVATSGTGAYTGSLFTFAYNKRDDLLKDKTLAGNDPSLVGYWPMEEIVMSGTTQTVKDYSINGNTGTLNGAGQYSIVNGVKWNALQVLNNNNGLPIRLPIVVSTGSSLTISVTYKTITKSAAWVSPIFALPWVMSLILEYSDFMEATNTPSTTTFTGSSAVNPYVWHTTTVTYDGQNERIFNDGNFIGSTTSTWSVQPGNLNLCTWRQIVSGVTSARPCWSAIFDEARVYSRVLSDSEILSLYNATR